MNDAFFKALRRLEMHATAVLEAMPMLKEAGDSYTGTDLDERVEEIGRKFGLQI